MLFLEKGDPRSTVPKWLRVGARLRVSVFPNPVRERLVVSFDQSEREHVKIQLLDISGKMVKVFVDDDLPNGVYQFGFSLETLPQGVYILQIINGDDFEARRIIVD